MKTNKKTTEDLACIARVICDQDIDYFRHVLQQYLLHSTDSTEAKEFHAQAFEPLEDLFRFYERNRTALEKDAANEDKPPEDPTEDSTPYTGPTIRSLMTFSLDRLD